MGSDFFLVNHTDELQIFFVKVCLQKPTHKTQVRSLCVSFNLQV